MIKNLKKIESSILEIEKSGLINPYLKTLLQTLYKERMSHYQNETIFFSVLNGDYPDLNLLDLFKKLRFTGKKLTEVSSVKPLEQMNIYSLELDKDKLKECGMFFFGKENGFNSKVLVRTQVMYDIVLEDLLSGGCENLFKTGKKEYKYNNSSFTFYIEMLSESEKEDLKDVCDNLQAYLRHPDVGLDNLKKEVANTLKKYYNTTLLFVKNEEENCYYEIEVI